MSGDRIRAAWEQHAGRIVMGLGFAGCMTLAGLLWQGGRLHERINGHDTSITELREIAKQQSATLATLAERVGELRGAANAAARRP